MFRPWQSLMSAIERRRSAHEALEASHALLSDALATFELIGDWRSRGIEIRIRHALTARAWVDTQPSRAWGL